MALETGEQFTKKVLKRYEDIPNPRMREVMQAAVKHLHAFVSEVKPTGEEWFKAIQYLTAIGHKCDDKRQEFILLSDTLGVSMLVDDINNRRVPGATPSTVEGPFHIQNSPEIADGGDMAKGAPGIPCFVTGHEGHGCLPNLSDFERIRWQDSGFANDLGQLGFASEAWGASPTLPATSP